MHVLRRPVGFFYFEFNLSPCNFSRSNSQNLTPLVPPPSPTQSKAPHLVLGYLELKRNMARSHRKTPICGITTAHSEKIDKKIWHSRMRARTHTHLNSGRDTDVMPITREVSNVWSFAKDGKQRFDPSRHPKLMRK